MVTRGQPWIVAIVLLAVVASGVGVVYVKYLSRKHFVQLEGLRLEREKLDVEWGQLQLEVGSVATHSRVERAARKRLQMSLPGVDEVVVVGR